jgi:DUF971 family protein
MAPTNLRALRDQKTLEVTWPDGVTHRIPFQLLRFECPCASCVNEFTGERTIRLENIPADVMPTAMHLTGNYALKVDWSDGHSTGLYAWEVIRRIGMEQGK